MQKWREFVIGSIIFIFSSMLSGAVIAFIITFILSLVTLWIPQNLKFILILIILFLFILHELKLIQLKLIQNHWQIPASWLVFGTKGNMLIWGLILGGGIFTFIPNIAFYLLYIVLGLFYNPLIGILMGALYGVSRTLPTIIYSLFKTSIYRSTSSDYHNILNMKKYNKLSNLIICLLYFVYIIFLQY